MDNDFFLLTTYSFKVHHIAIGGLLKYIVNNKQSSIQNRLLTSPQGSK